MGDDACYASSSPFEHGLAYMMSLPPSGYDLTWRIINICGENSLGRDHDIIPLFFHGSPASDVFRVRAKCGTYLFSFANLPEWS